MTDTYLDRLPTELLYEILSYLSCCHILRAFHSISDYLNGVLISYDRYLLDFSSSDIRKNEFDLVCSFLRPEQIVGLKLGKDRFDITNRFLLNVSRERPLTRLRSFWVNETIAFHPSYAARMNAMIDYNQLDALRLDCITLHNLNKPSSYLFGSLSRLVACSSAQFRRLSVQIPTHLSFLHMFFDSIDDLNSFLHPNAHQLKSLGVGIQCDLVNIHQFASLFNNYQWTQLIQFNLNLKVAGNIHLSTLRQVLLPMNRLKHLTLILSKQSTTNSNLFNGGNWELFLSTSLARLKTFNFTFPVDEQSEQLIYSCLNTFRSSWWLDQKRWFVEYVQQLGAFITVPYFAPKIFDNLSSYSFDLMFHAELFYLNILHLKLNSLEQSHLDELLVSQPGDRPRFCNVTQLSLMGNLTTNIFDKIRHNINIGRIEHFELSSLVDNTHAFAQLIMDMICLSSLEIQYIHSLYLFRVLSTPLFSIRHLVLLGHEATPRKLLFSHLCRLFPHLTHLTTNYHSRRTLCFLLNNLVNLEQINLHLTEDQHAPNHAWIERHSGLLMDSFESAVFNVDQRERIFVLWINATNRSIKHSHRRKLPKKCSVQ